MTEEVALFLHDCCGSGYKLVKEFKMVNPDVKIEDITYFNVHKRKLHLKYGFDITDLKKHSYIVWKGIITRGDNA